MQIVVENKVDKDSLWNKVITSIHNLDIRTAYQLSNKFKPGVQNNIVRIQGELVKRDIPMSKIIKRKIKSVTDTLFWSDGWIGNGPLKLTFPELFSMESHKRCNISDRIYEVGYSWS